MKTGANTLIKTKSKRQVGLLRKYGVKSYVISCYVNPDRGDRCSKFYFRDKNNFY